MLWNGNAEITGDVNAIDIRLTNFGANTSSDAYKTVERMDSHNSAPEMNNSSGFQLGDIVWAAADGYRLWPALIYESKDGTFIKGNRIVFFFKFLSYSP